MNSILLQCILALQALCVLVVPVQAKEWKSLGPGLELRRFFIPEPSAEATDPPGVLAVLRISPAHRLALGAALRSGGTRTMQDWAEQEEFLATINAGMFRADDRLRSTGHMRDAEVTINAFLHPQYGAFLAFAPRESGLPSFRWLDRNANPDWRDILTHYAGVIQNYRLISPARENLWAPSERRHSAAAIGLDRVGNLLFIHCRPRLSMHEFTQTLLDLPLDLIGAMYVEGGADAAMYVRAGGVEGRFVGEYENTFFQGSNTNFWPTPNVLGVRAK